MVKVIKGTLVFVILIALVFSLAILLGSCGASNFVTNEHPLDGDVDKILIDTSTARITLAPSEDGKTRVVCHEEEKRAHTVSLSDGTLTIIELDSREWFEHISIGFETTSLTIYLPLGQYTLLDIDSSTSDVEIPNGYSFDSADIEITTGRIEYGASTQGSARLKTSTGDITVRSITAAELDINASTGRITLDDILCGGEIKVGVSTGETSLTNVICSALTSSGSTGAITLKNVFAEDYLYLERSTGAVRLDGVDATEIMIETNTGSVTGSLKSGKIFYVSTNTGKKDVPESTTGGICEITTGTGDIHITIEN